MNTCLFICFITIAKSVLCTKAEECFAVPALHINAALQVWEYLKLNQPLKKSDLIIGLGSHDPRVAEEAVRLWLDGWADTLMFAGKSGNLTKGKWKKPEAEMFHDIAVSMGVLPSNILLETESTNTGENFKFCYEILKKLKRVPKRIIVVQKPHMGRRTFATFKSQWPLAFNETEIIVTSQNISLLRYPSDDVGDLQDVITVVIGYLQRMQIYADLGYQISQKIPESVWKAYTYLKNTGYYSNHLV